jgi:hypothetical protein
MISSLCSAPNIIRMIELMRMRWACGTHVEDEKSVQNTGQKA